ncbi:hypothetical protein MTO96_033774 [Rhipicephalus appendiculatus]
MFVHESPGSGGCMCTGAPFDLDRGWDLARRGPLGPLNLDLLLDRDLARGFLPPLRFRPPALPMCVGYRPVVPCDFLILNFILSNGFGGGESSD